MATIFDNQEEWTKLYHKLIYLLCKNNGRLIDNFDKQLSKLQSNNSFDKINMISNILKQPFDTNSLFSNLVYLIKMMEHLKTWKDGPTKTPSKTDDAFYTEKFNKVFENKSKLSLTFDRKKAAKNVQNAYNTLLVVCDVLIKAGAGNIPINDIKPEHFTTNNESLKNEAINLLNQLGMFTPNSKDVQNVIDIKRKESEKYSKEDKPKENWSVKKGLKSRASPSEVVATDTDTPDQITNNLWKIYQEYALSDIDVDYGRWVTDVIQSHKVYSSVKELLRLNYHIDVENDIKNGKFNFKMSFGTMKPDLIENVIKKYGAKNRLDTICFVPPIPTFYELFSLFKTLNVGFTYDKKILITGSIIAETANSKTDPIVKKMVDCLDIIKHQNEFGIEYMETVEAHSDIWYDYLEKKLTNSSQKIETVADKITGEELSPKEDNFGNIGDVFRAAMGEEPDEETPKSTSTGILASLRNNDNRNL